MAATTEALRDILGQVPGLKLAFLFGSMAKGSETPESDVDIALLCNSPLSAELSIDLIGRIGAELGRAVDLIDLFETPEPVTGEAIAGIRLVGTNTDFADLLVRHLVNVEDFVPLQKRIQRERREAWIGR